MERASAQPTRVCVVYPGDVVHAAGDEEHAVWRPGEVIDLGSGRPAHGLGPPRFFVFQAVFAEGRVQARVLGRNPQ